MVNISKIEGLFQHLKDYMHNLRVLGQYPQKEFLEDFTKINSAKYLLQIAIECCLAIGTHIISTEKYRSPEDYGDTFKVLCEKNIIPDDFIFSLQKMARFRNRLVHIYWDVDDANIYEIIQTCLSDFEKYLHYITVFLNKSN